jgi:hypothetical protein
MMLSKRFRLMEGLEVVTSTAAAPAAAPAPAADPAAAPPAANESLLPAPSAAPAVDPNAPVTEMGWLPDKFRVNGADGKLDLAASSQKLSDSYKNLEKTRGAMPPAAPTDYTFTPPAELGDLKFDDALSASFRESAHKAGMSQAQYEMVMSEYCKVVPQMLDATAKLSAAEARVELSKVWQSPAVFEAQVNNAARAISNAPADLQQTLHAKFGRDPDFVRFAAAMGQEMREDRAAQNPDGGQGGPETMEQLMAHPAYRDTKHPEHTAISKRVQAAAQRITPA